ncbi:hypothetical protein [Plesiomonas shigelloides]
MKENEISVVRQNIQDDADVEGDIYTIDNDGVYPQGREWVS